MAALADAPWFGISLIVHALVLMALVAWADPFEREQADGPAAKRDSMLSGERLTRLVDQVREIQRRELTDRLENLRAIEYRMEEMRQELNQEYREFSKDQADQGLHLAIQAQKAALTAQQRALEQAAGRQLDAAKKAQVEAATAMEEAFQRMSVSPAGAKALAAQEAARAAQREADLALDADREQASRLNTVERDAEHELQRQQQDLDRHQQEVAKVAEQAAQRQQEVDRRSRGLEEATARGQEGQIKQAKHDLAQAKREQASTEKELAQKQDAVAQRERELAERKAAAEVELTATREAAEQAAAAAAEIQAKAKAEQAAALAAAEVAAETVAQQQAVARDIPIPDMSQAYLQPEDLVATYISAASAERRITERYRDLRAAELAMIRDIPIEQAREIIEVPTPERAGLDQELLRKDLRSGQELPEHEAEMEQALAETAAMVNLASDLLAQLQKQQHSAQAGSSVAMLRDAAAAQTAIEAQVKEGGGNQSADVTALMKQGAGAAGRDSKSGPQGLVSYNVAHQEITPQDPSVPGRIITTRPDVPGAEWMYVDTWYTIGPFPNEGRRHIDTQFPPESVIDLDATYPGAGGNKVSWQFLQSTGPCVVPTDAQSWSVYYATTEIHCDRELELWMAVGSDDKSHIWINDVLVWVSEPHHKAWNIGEGYRKIHLRQGRNRVLYRIENGQFSMGFSLILHTAPTKVER